MVIIELNQEGREGPLAIPPLTLTEVWITVLEAMRGRPVVGADVTLFDMGSYVETTGKTDGIGVFKTFVRSSRYVITVKESGYRDWVLEVGIGGVLFEQVVVLITDAGGTPPDPPVVVDVAIHVNDSQGSPIVGANVSLGGWSRTTNWAGIAYFAEIGISVYDYVVVADGFHNAVGIFDVNKIKDLYLTLVPVEAPEPPPAKEYTLTVQVKYTDGTPAGSVAVSTVRLEGGYSNGGLTDRYGVIQFTNALLGNYRTSVGTEQKEVYLDRDKTVLFQIEAPPEPPNPEPEPEPGAWDFHSIYRGVQIQVWLPDASKYQATWDSVRHVRILLADLQRDIDDFLATPPPTPPPPEDKTSWEKITESWNALPGWQKALIAGSTLIGAAALARPIIQR